MGRPEGLPDFLLLTVVFFIGIVYENAGYCWKLEDE